MWGSPSGMFLQRRSYPEAYPLKPLRLSLNARVGEDVITGLSLFHDLPQAEPTYTVGRTLPLPDGLGGAIETTGNAELSTSGSGGVLCNAGPGTPVPGADWLPPRRGGRWRAIVRRLLPLLALRSAPARGSATRSRSAASLAVITSSQKVAKAFQASSPSSIALTIPVRVRSQPTLATSALRCGAHDRHTANVWCAVSSAAPHSWQEGASSRRMRCRYEPKHPCPVITCTILNVRKPYGLTSHRSRTGTSASNVRRPTSTVVRSSDKACKSAGR
jgi:hypothetical protein